MAMDEATMEMARRTSRMGDQIKSAGDEVESAMVIRRNGIKWNEDGERGTDEATNEPGDEE